MMELTRARNGISPGYKVLSDFVMRGLVRIILTTNFDTCLLDALKERQPHIRQVQEVNRGPAITPSLASLANAKSYGCTGGQNSIGQKLFGRSRCNHRELTLLLRPLLAGSPVIVIGYRGAEPSVMDGLFGQSGEGRLTFLMGFIGVYGAEKRPPQRGGVGAASWI